LVSKSVPSESLPAKAMVTMVVPSAITPVNIRAHIPAGGLGVVTAVPVTVVPLQVAVAVVTAALVPFNFPQAKKVPPPWMGSVPIGKSILGWVAVGMRCSVRKRGTTPGCPSPKPLTFPCAA
jgi:hypothetical protein